MQIPVTLTTVSGFIAAISILAIVISRFKGEKGSFSYRVAKSEAFIIPTWVGMIASSITFLILGVIDLETQQRLDTCPGPWAELYVVMEDLRNSDDEQAAMRDWDNRYPERPPISRQGYHYIWLSIHSDGNALLAELFVKDIQRLDVADLPWRQEN